MPTYEFLCKKCKKAFTLTISLSEHEKGRFTCPACDSTSVKQQITTFIANTSKKS